VDKAFGDDGSSVSSCHIGHRNKSLRSRSRSSTRISRSQSGRDLALSNY